MSFYKFTTKVFKYFSKTFYKYNVIGAENIPDEGNIIIVKENVKKVAENGNYILVERVEKKDKNYYIIEVKENKYIDDLSKKEFEEELGKKKIEKVKWFNAKRYKK